MNLDLLKIKIQEIIPNLGAIERCGDASPTGRKVINQTPIKEILIRIKAGEKSIPVAFADLEGASYSWNGDEARLVIEKISPVIVAHLEYDDFRYYFSYGNGRVENTVRKTKSFVL